MGKFREENRSNVPSARNAHGISRSAVSSINHTNYHRTKQGRVTTRHDTKETTYRFDSRVDARTKLINQKRHSDPAPKDARDILKRQNRSSRHSSSLVSPVARARNSSNGTRGRTDRGKADTQRTDRSRTNGRSRSQNRANSRREYDRKQEENISSRKEPLMIVTGLGGVEKDRHRRSNEARGHYVVSSGTNTFVTLSNDKYDAKRTDQSKKRASDNNNNTATFTSSKNLEPIKIKITNSNYVPKRGKDSPLEQVSQVSRTRYSQEMSDELLQQQQRYSKSEDSMDYDSSDYELPVESTLKNTYQRVLPSQLQHNKVLIPNSNIYNNNSTSLMSQPPPPQQQQELSSFNGTLNAFKPSGLVVNNFPTSGMYSSSYDNLWNINRSNFIYDQPPPPIKSPTIMNGGVASLVNYASNKEQTSSQVVSAKDGYKLLVSNLHPKVTEDDVLELFSDIGPIKRARFIDKGLAEVIYVRIEHAKEAIQKYDLKELDGRQMVIGFADKTHSVSEVATVKVDVTKLPPPIIPSSISSMSSIPPVYNSYNSRNASNSGMFNQPRVINQNINSTPANDTKYNQRSATDAPYKLNQTTAASNSLSNRFKSKESHIQIPESKHQDKRQSINYIDNSIIHQVLFKQIQPMPHQSRLQSNFEKRPKQHQQKYMPE